MNSWYLIDIQMCDLAAIILADILEKKLVYFLLADLSKNKNVCLE